MKQDEKLLMSVIMPVYNSAEYLDQTLLSVLGTYARDVELIAVDDGSTDDSLLVLRKYQKVIIICSFSVNLIRVRLRQEIWGCHMLGASSCFF